MLKIVKFPNRSPYWYVRGTVKGGERILESTGTTERARAEEYRVKRESEAWDRNALGYVKPANFSDAVSAYVLSKGKNRFLRKLVDHFKERPLPEIGQVEIDFAARVLYPKAKPSTLVRQVYVPMIAVLHHAVKAQMAGAVLRKIEAPKVERTEVQWSTDDQLTKLLRQCNPRLRAIVLVMTYTGLRISECLRMTPAAFQKRPGYVEVGKTKNGDPAMVPLPPIALQALERVLPVTGPAFGYTSQQGVNQALRKAAERAGVPYLSSHKIGRHTFAARLLNAGKDVKLVKEAGRWKTLRIVDQTYGHLEKARVHDAMLEVATGVELVDDQTDGANE